MITDDQSTGDPTADGLTTHDQSAGAPSTGPIAGEVRAGDAAATPARIDVRKTYKLFIGGAFPRSESGRVYPVHSADGALLAQVAHASRKDLRDAVGAARKAFAGWSTATAYNRGQILYRIAEMLESRRTQFVAEVRAGEGITAAQAEAQLDQAIDRWVWYAGWCDKYAQIAGSTNPVSGAYFSFSLPEPTGVVGVLAPQESSLLGLVSVLAPVLAGGNAAVVITSFQRPLPAATFAEVLATSDLPAGVVNLLTGSVAELAPWLASHRDVDALDLTGATAAQRPDLQRSAADTVKRAYLPRAERTQDWTADPGTGRLAAFVETKTVWHPIGV